MTSLVLKSDVDLLGLRPEVLIALQVALGVYDEYAQDNLVITSGIDGKHSRHSLHNTGNAIDIRLPDLERFNNEQLRNVEDQVDAGAVAADIQDRLTIDFDVVLEETHIHIEYQRETRA